MIANDAMSAVREQISKAMADAYDRFIIGEYAKSLSPEFAVMRSVDKISADAIREAEAIERNRLEFEEFRCRLAQSRNHRVSPTGAGTADLDPANHQ